MLHASSLEIFPQIQPDLTCLNSSGTYFRAFTAQGTLLQTLGILFCGFILLFLQEYLFGQSNFRSRCRGLPTDFSVNGTNASATAAGSTDIARSSYFLSNLFNRFHRPFPVSYTHLRAHETRHDL